MAIKLGLRVAIIWKGSVLQERIFELNKKESVHFSGDTHRKDAMIIPDFKDTLDGFTPESDGYLVRFPEYATGSISRDGTEESLDEIRKQASKAGKLNTDSGVQNLYSVSVQEGDWGLITIKDVSIYFQVRDTAIAAPISAFELPFQGPLVAAFLISACLHATVLMLCMLSPEYDPRLAEMRALDRFASYMVDDVDEPIEEVEDEDVDEDTTGKAMEGEEGKFGDEEAEVEESVLPKQDGEMIDKVDVKDIGLNKALSKDLMGSGPLSDVFSQNSNLDSKLSPAFSGSGGDLVVGRGAGGAGLKGTGSGGGGQGSGRIGGLGSVDTGGGKGVNAKIGKRKKRSVKPKVKSGQPSLGNFCEKSDIRRVVAQKNRAIQNCFETELRSQPDLSGKVTATWQVGLDGKVMSASIASSTLNNKSVEGCMVRVIRTMRFKAPDGGICVINYPFVFTGLE